jgi:psp operon transcriptional activator
VVHLPALHQRPGDIPELATHFGLHMCAELGWELFPGFSDSAMAALMAHDWPGNVRELKNAVERSLHRWADPSRAVAEVVIDPFVSPYANAGAGPQQDTHSADTRAVADAAPPASPPVPGAITDFARHMHTAERELVAGALRAHNGHQRRAAAALKLSYDQLRGLVRKHRLGGTPRRSR